MINIYNIFAGMKIWLSFILFLWIAPVVSTQAQAPVTYNAATLYQRIERLKVLGSVLYVAAHPDDENTRLLGWLSNGRLYRTGYLSITRGDGGQNLIGEEQGIALGLIRTQELLAARKIDGAEQFFTRAYDFGFSKSTEESLKIWEQDKVLADAVWVIRNFRPDVIITRFPPDKRAGHGHHSASSVIAALAFKAAADPKMFPEQLKKGVEPWQAKRILWNSYNFGSGNYTSEEQMKIDVGGYNVLLGKSYGEIAAESRTQHKSQGFGVSAGRGSMLDYFTLTDGESCTSDLMENVNTGWSRIGAGKIENTINSILRQYKIDNPASSIPALVALYKEVEKLKDGYWRSIKLKELQDIIVHAAGLWLEAYTNTSTAVRGEPLHINFSVNNRDGATVTVKNLAIEYFDTTVNIPAGSNKNIGLAIQITVPENKEVTQPYWLAHKMTQGSFNVQDQQLIGKAESEPAFTARFTLNIQGLDLVYTRPLVYKNTDPVKGELYHPVIVMPKPSEQSSYGALKHIQYDHIPDIYYFDKDTSAIRLSNVKIAGKKIGYIEGAGDKVPAALQLMGYDVTALKEKDMHLPYLKQFDAIITGVRAYNVHSYLSNYSQLLNDYVAAGGNLIVQYNTNNSIGPNKIAIGPYPFFISRDRITDENSPVKFLLPHHQILNYPNKITAADFEDWVQERAIYMATQLDPAFVAPIAMNDPGEEEHNGALVIADHGKGKFVYTGIVFFRELPAGIEGAYRLLANIIALNKKPT